MSEESLFREVDEEVRQDQYKKLWERHGNLIMGLCFLMVAGVAGFKGYQYLQVQKSQSASLVYFQAVKEAMSGKNDDALAALKAVDQNGYKQLARMQEPIVLAQQGKTDEAVKAYDAIIADASVDAKLRDVARIRAGYLLVDTAKPDELLSRLGQFDKDGQSWRHAAREIFGLSAYRTGDYAMAERYMSAIFADPQAPQDMRDRAQVMIQLLTPLIKK